MSKFTNHNRLRADSVNSAIEITDNMDEVMVRFDPETGVVDLAVEPTVGGSPFTSAFVQQADITDLTDNSTGTPAASVEDMSVTTTAAGVMASGDLDGADTVDEAGVEAAFLALETEVGLLKDDVEALATALGVANDNVASLNAQLVAINAALLAAGVTAV